ncbi:MAG: hypothetical protein R3A45_01625 [Bdellovibrionota bacterium]
MSKDQQINWVGQKVKAFLATPLAPLGTREANVFTIEAEVVAQAGAGLQLNIHALYDQHHNQVSLDTKKIFLPFSKVDYISLP